MIPILIERELKKLAEDIGTIRGILAWPEPRLYTVEEDLSLWSPVQQVHHAALVVRAVLERIEVLYADESPEILRSGRPTGRGYAVLLFGRIPRGRGRSPEPYISPPETTRAEVEELLKTVDKQLQVAVERARYLYDVKGRWPHPVLGAFNCAEWVRFLRVHTDHHLEIAEQIGEKHLERQA
ncbi:hypothetical protein GC173_06500 [bacterium]|nr:hypothetical protein [bacterium]